jgi:hypothetical protein
MKTTVNLAPDREPEIVPPTLFAEVEALGQSVTLAFFSDNCHGKGQHAFSISMEKKYAVNLALSLLHEGL